MKFPAQNKLIKIKLFIKNTDTILFKKQMFDGKGPNEYIKTNMLFDNLQLNQKGKTIVEYVWLGGTGQDIRSKSKTFERKVESIEDLDEWNYDGSSTYQANTESSEVLLKPVALFDDPFRGEPNKIAFCETFHINGNPTNSNFRHFAKKILDKDLIKNEEPWFGIEQEYALMVPIGTSMEWPYGWPMGGYPKPQGQYYCSTGTQNNYGRDVMNAHYKACLNAGIKIYGTNAEVMPGQWEFQIGTCKGIEIADHLWMARYLLLRVCEHFNLGVNFEPKPVSGDWNGSGCHTNYSTNSTRSDVELKTIKYHMERLRKTHSRLIRLYGENNQARLTGIYKFYFIFCFFIY